jgi:hypothetical protein
VVSPDGSKTLQKHGPIAINTPDIKKKKPILCSYSMGVK